MLLGTRPIPARSPAEGEGQNRKEARAEERERQEEEEEEEGRGGVFGERSGIISWNDLGGGGRETEKKWRYWETGNRG